MIKKAKLPKIAVILGTRPEIIKMSPLIRELKKIQASFFIIHTNQHYDENLDKKFFEQLNLPNPKYNLNIGSGRHGETIGKAIIRIEKVLINERPGVVFVEGDTNTVLAGALAASKLNVKIGHIESGLRSFDRLMPEEINRIITDHCSDFLFAPTKESKMNLLKEGIEDRNIYVTGNTIVDAIKQNLAISAIKSKILKTLDLKPKQYLLVTAHRQENVDNKKKLENILKGLELLYGKFEFPVVFPIHPRTKTRLSQFKINLNKIMVIDPVGYLDFIKIMKNAALILTDSGGIQEEACLLKVPCVTLRENTERPETLEIGGNILSGTQPESILKSSKTMIKKRIRWKNPFGRKGVSKRILTIVSKRI